MRIARLFDGVFPTPEHLSFPSNYQQSVMTVSAFPKCPAGRGSEDAVIVQGPVPFAGGWPASGMLTAHGAEREQSQASRAPGPVFLPRISPSALCSGLVELPRAGRLRDIAVSSLTISLLSGSKSHSPEACGPPRVRMWGPVHGTTRCPRARRQEEPVGGQSHRMVDPGGRTPWPAVTSSWWVHGRE